MLRAVELTNFKSFAYGAIQFAPLTLLMGENGAGKSSIIQSLLLLRQSTEDGRFDELGLRLNGALCSVGLGRDLLREGADDDEVGLSYESDDGLASYRFEYRAESDRLPVIGNVARSPNIWSGGFGYLSAERSGPRLTNPRSIASASERQFGVRGEGALAVLESYRAEILPSSDPRRRGSPGSLEELFQQYLADISSNARIELRPYQGVDSIGSTFSFSLPGQIPGLPFRPTNVGFGLSYSLPIIVGCLTAQPGSLLVVENPEAHLHTKGQRTMGELLARTAMAGVQVIVETHSREIFYHLRRKAIEAVLPSSIGRMNYIEASMNEAGQRVSSCSTVVGLDGSLSDLSEEFFDMFGSPTDMVMPR